MSFRYAFGATPEVESVSLQLKLFSFLDRTAIKVSSLKSGAAYSLVIFTTFSRFFFFFGFVGGLFPTHKKTRTENNCLNI